MKKLSWRFGLLESVSIGLIGAVGGAFVSVALIGEGAPWGSEMLLVWAFAGFGSGFSIMYGLIQGSFQPSSSTQNPSSEAK